MIMKSILLVLLVIASFNSNAQLCTGSLGDPVVNITFGNGNTQPAALKKGVTNLRYVSTDCPTDGEYTITNSTSRCHSNAWHTTNEDHTKDLKGRFMLINAGSIASNFFIDTISGLCRNTTYEFSAWIANVLKSSSCNGRGVKPNLSFKIETITGIILDSINTQDINDNPNLIWEKYGFQFKPDINTTSIVLKIKNNSLGGSSDDRCGNDLAIDDIAFRPCFPLMKSEILNNLGLSSICLDQPKSLELTASIENGLLAPFYQWQSSFDHGKSWLNISGANSTKLNLQAPISDGTFMYRMQVGELANQTNQDCRVPSPTISVHLLPSNTEKTISQCRGSDVELFAANSNDSLIKYLWNGPKNFKSISQNPSLKSVHISDSGIYSVDISNNYGCVVRNTINLKVFNAIVGKLTGNSVICFGESTQLTASGSTHFTWVPSTGLSANNTGTVIANPKDTTQYYVLIGDGTGCSDSISINIKVVKPPIVNAGADKSILAGNSINLLGSISGQYQSYRWTPNFNMLNANSLSPTVMPTQTTSYELRAVAAASCGEVKDTVKIVVYIKTEPPNAFSPNGDGVNDLWVIPGLELYPKAALTVFNRAGMVVYQSKPYSSSWDGTFKGSPLPVGTYYYIIERGMGFEVLSGSIQLIR